MEDSLNKKIQHLNRNSQKNHMLNRLNAYDWISSCFKVDGKNFNIEKIHKMMQGALSKDAKLSDFTELEKYKKLVKFAFNSIEMGNSFDRNIMKKMNKEISYETVDFRKTNSPLLDKRYTPLHSSNILIEIKKMESNLYLNWKDGTYLEKAAYLFGSIVKIAPFESGNLQIAISSAFYFLMYNGYPIPSSLYLTREDLIDQSLNFIEKNNILGIYDLFFNSIDKKLDAIIKA